MSSPDFDQPIATLLRDGTSAAHEAAEKSEGAGYLTRGLLDKQEYVRFLIMLYHVYLTLEQALEQHAALPALAPTYNPTLLARSASLQSDIAHLLSVPVPSLSTHPLWSSMISSPPPALKAYTSRLTTLRDTSPAALLSHGYVRYLGDLSGGQFIRRRVEKAYGLEDDRGAGTSFYEFGKLGDVGASATLGDMKRIKEWYREGMNRGVGDDVKLKALVLAEANTAFELNNGLFAELKPPSNPPTPPQSPTHALGDPVSPIEPSPASRQGYYPLQVPGREDESEVKAREKGEGAFTTQGVVSFIVAMCLAHFLLVVGGFTGARGWEKYVAVQEWIGRTRGTVIGL